MSTEAATPTTVAQLGPYDVLCGRDKKCSSNLGNQHFRTLISETAHMYLKCESKFERSKAIGITVKELQDNPHGSIRFFKRVKGSDVNDENAALIQLDEKQSREKIAHALRDYAASRRNSQAKEQEQSPPRNAQNPGLDQRIFPGSNPAPDLSLDDNVSDRTSLPHIYGRNPSPRISELLEEEARLQAEIEALQAPMNSTSSAAYQGSLDSTVYANNEELNSYGGSMNQQQYYHQQQQPLEDEHEGSEGYDDFNVDDYNQFVKPMASSIRNLDTQTDIPQEQVINNSNQQTGNNNYNLQAVAGASEDYDAFEQTFEPLRGGTGNSSIRKRDSIEKNASRRPMKGQGLVRHQGSLRQMDVFQNSFRNRMSNSSLRDSMGETDLMLMSMGTLTLNDSEMMNESEVFPMGDSVVFNQSRMGSSRLSMDTAKLDMSLQGSTLDMSLQQSKLDMSFDTSDVSGEKRSNP